MAAPNTFQSGANFLITAGGQTIGGRRGATLTLETAGVDASAVEDGHYDYVIGGMRGWSLSFENLFLEGNLKISGRALQLLIAAAGGALAPLEAVDNVAINLTADVEEVFNEDDAFERAYTVVRKSAQVTANMAYLDPAGAGGTVQKVLFDAERAASSIDWECRFGTGLKLAGSGIVGTIPLSAPHRSTARMNGVTILPQGAVQLTGTPNVGLAALLNAYFAEPSGTLAVVFKTNVTGATQWSGSAFATQLNITVPRSGVPTVNGTLTGTGPLTRGTTA